jgi:tryptophan 2,3-dioxygenase
MLDISKLKPQTAVATIQAHRERFLIKACGNEYVIPHLGDALDDYEKAGGYKREATYKAFEKLRHVYFNLLRWVGREEFLKFSKRPEAYLKVLAALETGTMDAKRVLLAAQEAHASYRVISDACAWEEWISHIYIEATHNWLNVYKSPELSWATRTVSSDLSIRKDLTDAELKQLWFVEWGAIEASRARGGPADAEYEKHKNRIHDIEDALGGFQKRHYNIGALVAEYRRDHDPEARRTRSPSP